MLLAAVIFLFALLDNVLAVLVNRTIDDEFGDPTAGFMPTYSPKTSWTQGANCTPCGAQPDVRKVFNRTWHDSTYYVGEGQNRTITIPFNGAKRLLTF